MPVSTTPEKCVKLDLFIFFSPCQVLFLLLESLIILLCAYPLFYTQSYMSYSCTERDAQARRAKFHSSFALQLCFCPQLPALGSDTALRLMDIACAGKPRHRRTHQDQASVRNTETQRSSINTRFPGWNLPFCGIPRVLYK